MPHTGTQPLETQRLHLRRFCPEDAQPMFENWACDPEVTRFLRWQPHKSPAETAKMVAEWTAGYHNSECYHWAIQRKEDGVLLGAIGIFPNCEADEPEGWAPAYCIGRGFWGQGYTSEALQAVMDYFMENTGIYTLYCSHAKENPASGRVMEHCGFRRYGQGKYHRFDGSAVPAYLYRYEKE